jgi:tRNA(adenine34) deaminase
MVPPREKTVLEIEDLMALAIEEAETSLRQGDCGFGAVVARQGEVVARARDTEKTGHDPTAHAELTAIRQAARELGRDLSACQLISTHEPCPMCASAMLWAGITTVCYGCSISDSIKQGRTRIDLSCKELYERAGKPLTILEGVCAERCSLLYNREVREQMKMLRGADAEGLEKLAHALAQKRIAWFHANADSVAQEEKDPLDKGYLFFLKKLGLSSDQAPILERTPRRLVLASRNFCPTLEACKILGLDTRLVCKHLTEFPMIELLKQVHPKLRFARNYETLRPYGQYCEEVISLDD